MSQSDSATNSVDSQLSRSPSARTARSQEADANQQEKQRNRRMTVYGDSHTLHFQSPDVNAVSIKRASLPTPKEGSTSPAMSSSFSRSPSGRSLSSGSEVHISPGQYPPYTTDSSPEPGLKHRETGTAGLPSLSDGSTGIITANVAIDGIIRHLVGCVKEFKAPSELDFSATTKERPLFLAGTKKNRPFMNQFCKLTGLRNELAAIPTHGNRNLEDKHQKTDMAIGRALERMKNHQLKLYDEFTTAFDCVRSALDEYVASFEYPSELDFVANRERTGMYLLNNDKNKPFINQLLILHGLRTWLAVIPTHGDPERKYKCQAVSEAVEKAIKDMQKHQLKLWNKNAKARL